MPYDADLDSGAGRRGVEVLLSPVSELDWLRHKIGRDKMPSTPRLAALAPVLEELQREVTDMWQDGYSCLPDISILAERIGVLFAADVEPFLRGLDRAAQIDGVGLELLSERPDERVA